MLSRTSSSSTPARSAISRVVGARPSSWPRVPIVRSSSRCSSCTRRGTRTAHPLSRKWRLSSPMMVGVANDENWSPRSGSNRSTALTRPISATWRRSSRGSPRCAKRRAMNSASRMCSWTSSLRSARSPVRRYAANRVSVLVGSAVTAGHIPSTAPVVGRSSDVLDDLEGELVRCRDDLVARRRSRQ